MAQRGTPFHPIPGSPTEAKPTPEKYVHGKCTLAIVSIRDLPAWYRRPADLRSDTDTAVASYADLHSGAQAIMDKCLVKYPYRLGWYAPSEFLALSRISCALCCCVEAGEVLDL